MSTITVKRTIQAPVDRVFAVVADVQGIPDRDPAVESIEFLSAQQSGAGTRFRETRVQGRRSTVTELEVTEQVDGEYARFVSDMGGTVWDTVFSTRSADSGTELEIRLDARPHKLLARIATPLIRGMVRRGMEKHIDSIKAYCETVEA